MSTALDSALAAFAASRGREHRLKIARLSYPQSKIAARLDDDSPEDVAVPSTMCTMYHHATTIIGRRLICLYGAYSRTGCHAMFTRSAHWG